MLVSNSRNEMVECGREDCLVTDVMQIEDPMASCWRAFPTCFEDFVAKPDVGRQIPMGDNVIDVLADTGVRRI